MLFFKGTLITSMTVFEMDFTPSSVLPFYVDVTKCLSPRGGEVGHCCCPKEEGNKNELLCLCVGGSGGGAGGGKTVNNILKSH